MYFLFNDRTPPTPPARLTAKVPCLLAAAALLSCSCAFPAGVPRTWAAASGNWSLPANWNPPQIPAAGDTIFVTPTDGMDRLIIYDFTGAPLNLFSLTVNLTDAAFASTANCTFSIPANTLSATAEYIGYSGAGSNGRGAVNQTGGTNTYVSNLYLGYNSSDVGSYTLATSATLSSGSTSTQYIGYSGNGNMTQSGGLNKMINSNLYLAYNASATGSYTLSGSGALSGSIAYIGRSGAATFSQSGTSSVAFTGIDLATNSGSSASYAITDTATLTTSGLDIGDAGNATFTQTGGSNIINSGPSISLVLADSAGATASYSLSGNATLSAGNAEIIGNGGSATFTQAGGTNTVHDGLTLAAKKNSYASYTLSAGLLYEDANESIAAGGNADFIHSGGTHSVDAGANLTLGAGGSATYSLSGAASLVVTGSEIIGSSTTATFTQSGGTNSIPNGSLRIGNNAPGVYNLSAGTLSVGTINLGNFSAATFIQTGGTVTVTGALNFNASANYAERYNLSGTSSLTISGNISLGGAGTFVGSAPASLSIGGTLTVDAADTFNSSATLNSHIITNRGTFSQSGALTQTGNFYNSGSMFLSGLQTWSPATTFTNDGTAVIQSNLGSPASPNVSVTTSSVLSFSTNQNLASLYISGGTTTVSAGTVKTNSLTFFGTPAHPQSKLDITTGALIIQDTANHASALADSRSEVAYGATHAAGITAAVSAGRTLVVVDNAVAHLTTFRTQPVDNGSILLMYTYIGDANLDGTITASDYTQLDAGFLLHLTPSWSTGDFNNDGVINYLDYSAIDSGLLAFQGNGPLAQSEIAQHAALFGTPYLTALQSLTPIPEPLTSSLLIAASPLLLLRRKCSRP